MSNEDLLPEQNAYLDMPYDCTECPPVLFSLAGVERYRQEAEEDGAVTLADPGLDDAVLLIDVILRRMRKMKAAEEDAKLSANLICLYARKSRVRQCKGVDAVTGLCGLQLLEERSPTI